MNKKSINDKISQYPVLLQLKDALFLKNLSDITVTNYMDTVARFLDFIAYDGSFDINEEHFRRFLFYLHSLPIEKNTVNNYNSHIRFFFNAVLNISVNPYRVPMAKTSHKPVDFLFDHQIRNLLAVTYPDSRFDCIVKLALCCGLRINEIVSLKVCDIHTKDAFKSVFVRESKRNKSRFVPIDNTVYCSIQRYAKEFHISPGTDAFFFSFSKNYPHSCNQTVRSHFNRFRDLAGIQDSFTFHCLRHTFAVNFIKSGGDIIELKYLLGHGSVAATSRYLHCTKNMIRPHISYIDSLLKGAE